MEINPVIFAYDRYVVICMNGEERREFSGYLDAHGYRWSSGGSLLVENHRTRGTNDGCAFVLYNNEPTFVNEIEYKTVRYHSAVFDSDGKVNERYGNLWNYYSDVRQTLPPELSIQFDDIF